MTTIGRDAVKRINLIVSQGADNVYSFRVSEMIGGVLVPVDFSGYTARSQIRDKVGGELWYAFDNIELGVDGVISLTLPHEVTEDSDWDCRDTGVWDIELSSNNFVTRYFSGVVTVSHDVTRSV